MAVKLHRLPRGAKGLRGMIKTRKGPVTGTDLGLQKKYGTMERADRLAQMEHMERGLEGAKSVTGSMIPGGLGIKAMRPRDQKGVMATIKRALTGKVPAKPVSVNISQFKKDPKHSLTSTKVEMFNDLLPLVLEMGEGVYRFGLVSSGLSKLAGLFKRKPQVVPSVPKVRHDPTKAINALGTAFDHPAPVFKNVKPDSLSVPGGKNYGKVKVGNKRAYLKRKKKQAVAMAPKPTSQGKYADKYNKIQSDRNKEKLGMFLNEFVLAFGEDVYAMGFADAQRKLLSLVSKKKIPLADYINFLGRPDVKKVEERTARLRVKPRLPK